MTRSKQPVGMPLLSYYYSGILAHIADNCDSDSDSEMTRPHEEGAGCGKTGQERSYESYGTMSLGLLSFFYHYFIYLLLTQILDTISNCW